MILVGSASERSQHLLELINRYGRNLRRLEIQIADHGGEMSAPIEMLNQRDETRAEIERLKAELRMLELDGAAVASLEQGQPAAMPRAPIRVFISSTMKDLQPEREAVERALQSLDLQAVRAETIGSQSASPYEVSLMMAQNCDIYLGIYGGRYGTVVPGDGRSITEIEYHTARQLGKPILIYRKTGVEVESEQGEFLKFVGDLQKGHTWYEFAPEDVPGNLIAQVQKDVRAEIERHPEWAQRAPAKGRVLLASLGQSPGAVIGLYHALARIGKRATRVVTFPTANRDVRDANGICEDEFRRLGVPYAKRFVDVEDIQNGDDGQAFKSIFYGLLQESLDTCAEVMVGITGGRSIMGALMAIVVQTTALERVALYHLGVDEDIEEDGRLPRLWNFQSDERRWRELLAPPPEKCRLVQVPFVRFPAPNKE
jgi:hypothetical protein